MKKPKRFRKLNQPSSDDQIRARVYAQLLTEFCTFTVAMAMGHSGSQVITEDDFDKRQQRFMRAKSAVRFVGPHDVYEAACDLEEAIDIYKAALAISVPGMEPEPDPGAPARYLEATHRALGRHV